MKGATGKLLLPRRYYPPQCIRAVVDAPACRHRFTLVIDPKSSWGFSRWLCV
jgi:hypothetical protein